MIETTRGIQLLYTATDRLGWNAALHPGPRTWIEVSFSGSLLGKYDLKTPNGLSLWTSTMTANGNVYAQILNKGYDPHNLATLDRSTGFWQRVTNASGDWLIGSGGKLIGSEGDNLVLAAGTSLQLVPPSELRSQPF